MWRDARVWEAVTAELRTHRQRGLGRLLTEDTVRFATARALVDVGADPAALHVEWPHPALKGSRIDLVCAGPTPTLLVEFKYPREPVEKNAPWTMALGEVLKDLYRLAACPGEVDRLFVYAETARLRQYMANAATRYGLDLDADQVRLDPADAARLPTTAAQIIGAELAAHHVTARRTALVDVDPALRLAVYHVDPLNTADSQSPGQQTGDRASPDPPAPAVRPPAAPPPAGTRHGARREILDAARAVLTRSGGQTFTVAEIIAEMNRGGTGYAEPTIRTMVTSHMCANAPDHAGTTYNDFERVDRGRYRFRPSRR